MQGIVLPLATVCSFVYVGLDLWKAEADRAAEAIAATDSDNSAEWELFSTEAPLSVTGQR